MKTKEEVLAMNVTDIRNYTSSSDFNVVSTNIDCVNCIHCDNCKKCNKEVYYHNYRGAKISELRCECGGELKGKSRPNLHKGQKFQVCVVENRRRLGCEQIPYKSTHPYCPIGKIFPENSWICGYCKTDLKEVS